MNIIIKKKYLLYKGYKFKCSVGKSGIHNTKKEVDFVTPKGTFKMGPLYFRNDKIKFLKCDIKKIIITKNMGWCDDIKSQKYNREIKFPFKYSAEKLYRKDRIYDIFINIKYNYSPTKRGNGSAIFLHLSNKKYKPTRGCIGILKKDFMKILPLINQNTKISIQ